MNIKNALTFINEDKHWVSACSLEKTSWKHSTRSQNKPCLGNYSDINFGSLFPAFETHFRHTIHSKTEVWEALNEDNDSDIIVALQN